MSSPKNMNTPKTWGNLSMKEKAVQSGTWVVFS